MSYLFYFDDENLLVLRPDCVKLCPELGVLDAKELALVILVYDNHSKYRQFPEIDRKRKAAIDVYGEVKNDIFESLKIKNAIDAYKSLQYDPKIDLAEKYQEKIYNMLKLLDEDGKSTQTIQNTMKTIDLLRKSIKELEQETVSSVIMKGQVKGGQELSFLEEIQKNRKYYLSVIAKK
nr:hypothetical protein [uncultured Flavobacterium sp.]